MSTPEIVRIRFVIGAALGRSRPIHVWHPTHPRVDPLDDVIIETSADGSGDWIDAGARYCIQMASSLILCGRIDPGLATSRGDTIWQICESLDDAALKVTQLIVEDSLRFLFRVEAEDAKLQAEARS